MSATMTESTIDKYLERALYFAERSTINRHKTGAVIVPPNPNLAVGGWSHDSLFKLTNYRSIHAEVHAILRNPHRTNLIGATIFVATIAAKSCNVTLSKPCDQCLAYLYEVGIKRAYFTVDNSDYDWIDII